jgi:alkylated DNA repair dioxygenase AlkB
MQGLLCVASRRVLSPRVFALYVRGPRVSPAFEPNPLCVCWGAVTFLHTRTNPRYPGKDTPSAMPATGRTKKKLKNHSREYTEFAIKASPLPKETLAPLREWALRQSKQGKLAPHPHAEYFGDKRNYEEGFYAAPAMAKQKLVPLSDVQKTSYRDTAACLPAWPKELDQWLESVLLYNKELLKALTGSTDLLPPAEHAFKMAALQHHSGTKESKLYRHQDTGLVARFPVLGVTLLGTSTLYFGDAKKPGWIDLGPGDVYIMYASSVQHGALFPADEPLLCKTEEAGSYRLLLSWAVTPEWLSGAKSWKRNKMNEAMIDIQKSAPADRWCTPRNALAYPSNHFASSSSSMTPGGGGDSSSSSQSSTPVSAAPVKKPPTKLAKTSPAAQGGPVAPSAGTSVSSAGSGAAPAEPKNAPKKSSAAPGGSAAPTAGTSARREGGGGGQGTKPRTKTGGGSAEAAEVIVIEDDNTETGGGSKSDADSSNADTDTGDDEGPTTAVALAATTLANLSGSGSSEEDAVELASPVAALSSRKDEDKTWQELRDKYHYNAEWVKSTCESRAELTSQKQRKILARMQNKDYFYSGDTAADHKRHRDGLKWAVPIAFDEHGIAVATKTPGSDGKETAASVFLVPQGAGRGQAKVRFKGAVDGIVRDARENNRTIPWGHDGPGGATHMEKVVVPVKLGANSTTRRFPGHGGLMDHRTEAQAREMEDRSRQVEVTKEANDAFEGLMETSVGALADASKITRHTARQMMLAAYDVTVNLCGSHTPAHVDEVNNDGPGALVGAVSVGKGGLFYFRPWLTTSTDVPRTVWLDEGDVILFTGVLRLTWVHGVWLDEPTPAPLDPSSTKACRKVVNFRLGECTEAYTDAFNKFWREIYDFPPGSILQGRSPSAKGHEKSTTEPAPGKPKKTPTEKTTQQQEKTPKGKATRQQNAGAPDTIEEDQEETPTWVMEGRGPTVGNGVEVWWKIKNKRKTMDGKDFVFARGDQFKLDLPDCGDPTEYVSSRRGRKVAYRFHVQLLGSVGVGNGGKRKRIGVMAVKKDNSKEARKLVNVNLTEMPEEGYTKLGNRAPTKKDGDAAALAARMPRRKERA